MVEWIFRLARWSAVLGGAVLAALMVMVVLSVSGRALVPLGLGPVPGDFELVEVGTAVAVFLFLPWCYLRGGHASVDLVYERFPARLQWLVVTLADALMLALWAVLTERLYGGMVEKRAYLETTFILLMPIWWGYALCLLGGVVGCLAYLAKLLIQFRLASWPTGWTLDASGGH